MYSQPSQNERQQFDEEYPSLTSLLLSWTVAYGREDEEVLSECLEKDSPEELRGALEQGRKLLQQAKLPWTIISDIANYSFLTERDAREWLTWLIDALDAALSAERQQQPTS